jgi:NAD(P)-dependent dehydrogenase (short-subunit alcohol dehydrogenase family)
MPLPESPGQPDARVLLLTGAAGGIGQAVLRRARHDGYRVFAVDRAEPPAWSRDDALIHWFRADVTRDHETEAVYIQLKRVWGRLDAAVLAAGAVGAGRAETVEPDEFRRLIELNLTAAFTYARLALPELRRSKGCLVFMSSTNGLTGGSPLSGPAYAAAKAGLIALARNIARDYGAEGVRANCLAPGPIDTPMLDRLPDSVKDSLRTSIPLGHIGSADDVANAVSFLCSDQARYLTGVTLSVSGGMVMV